MQRQEQQIISGTDMNLVGEVQQEYYNVLKILIDPQLQPLKSRISMLYQNLSDHLQSEQNYIKKCKITKGEIDQFLGKINTSNKIIEDENLQSDNIKKDLEKLQLETEELKRKQNDIRDNITRHKLQLNIIEKDLVKGLQQIDIRQQNDQNQLKKKLQAQQKIKDELIKKKSLLNNQLTNGMQEISEIQKTNNNVLVKIDALQDRIRDIEARDMKQKRNNDTKRDQLNKTKMEKDQLKEKKTTLDAEIGELDTEIQETIKSLKQEKKAKDQISRTKVRKQKQLEQAQKDLVRREEENKKLQTQKEQKISQIQTKQNLFAEAQKQRQKMEEALAYATTQLNKIIVKNQDISRQKAQIIKLKSLELQSFQKMKSAKEKERVKANQIQSKKLQKDKTLKTKQNKERQLQQVNVQQKNKLKKLKNQVQSYQYEHQKLAKILQQVKIQQQKYGIDASHAHSKYYQIMEQLRIKNTQIQNLKRQNQQVQNKCKYQQNLYQAVRSDRNLYSKDYLKSKDQIIELRKKYKRMTNAVDNLREEIKNKDQELVELDKQFKKVQSENVKIRADKNRAKSQIQSTEEVIKYQENHIGHLKKHIQQGQSQKAKQQKDYDMVRNQRDILGTQLIKRNQELALLYEKIKLSNSNLMKGEIYRKDKIKQFNDVRVKLATFRNQFIQIEQQIRCTDILKAQISFKQKQLLSQKAKIKALEDELTNPMNVHRWRKLQATDQQNYERILKIQTLQRRLISKTQQVEAKENLIRDKQKLFLQLKNILSRQPGGQVRQQLIRYKEALKQKTSQMKKMKKELQDSHEQMNSTKFEVDRIRSEMAKMKSIYFELREASEKEVIEERNHMEEQEMAKLDATDMELNMLKK